MAWSWSHSAAAYATVEENIHGKSRRWLEECYGEWRVYFYFNGDTTAWDAAVYDLAVAEAREIDTDTLAMGIFEWAFELATCDNGGFNAYCCPDGCHTVSFDREEPDEPEDLPEVEEVEGSTQIIFVPKQGVHGKRKLNKRSTP